MKTINSRLGIKLFLSYFVVILIGMLALGVTARLTMPSSYQRHLMMQQSGAAMGMGQGLGQNGAYQNFQQSFNEVLLVAVVAATLIALAVSFIFSRSILAPVNVMKIASRRIAEGHYDERVELRGEDELHQLAGSFNQMAEQLEQVENMRRQLIGDVAHELRTPLTAIKGTAEGLMDGIFPASDETYLQIHAEAERLSRLVDDLQELSRVESRAMQLDIRPINSSAVIQTVTKRMQSQFDKKRVALNVKTTPDPVHFLGDEDRVVQILTNLIGNALQHTPENGSVTVSVKRDNNEARIEIRDTGAGIPKEHLAKIFDRFYRVDKSRSRAHGGSGIGLTIAKHLVEAQGGKIYAKSAGENKGSAFSFTLPV